MNDYIYVYDDNENKLKMEVVLSFKLEDESKQYIIYKELDKKFPLYAAKFNLNVGISDLDTNLTKEEKIIISKIVKERILGNI